MGRVVRVVGLLIESLGPHAHIGEVCEVMGAPGSLASLVVIGVVCLWLAARVVTTREYVLDQ